LKAVAKARQYRRAFGLYSAALLGLLLTQVQRFGSALNLNIHWHMLFLDGVYTERANGSLRFHRVAAPTGEELSQLVHRLAQRIGWHLERQSLLWSDS
jgi:hypothetical protein